MLWRFSSTKRCQRAIRYNDKNYEAWHVLLYERHISKGTFSVDTFVLFLLLITAVLLSAVIDQMVSRISLPLVQIGIGIIIAIFAVSPIKIEVDPNLFLVLFIAPLIFDESKRIDKVALWKNRKPVLTLAVGLVVAAALAIGFYVNWLIPSIPLAAAFALGAALGPTDAVAVSSLSKETNIDSRQKSVLEAESLINDASGIVSFQFAIAAVVTGAFSLVDVTISFVFSFVGGILLGIVLAYVFGFLVRKIRAGGLDNTTFHVLYEVCIPFLIYLAANALGVSGILAVVAAGLMNVMSPRTMGPIESRLNIVSSSVWKVITFTLNGIVFVLLGAQLPAVMQTEWNLPAVNNFDLILYVFIITAGLVVIRFAWIALMRVAEKWRAFEKGKRGFNKEDWRGISIMTFAGARGAITLSLVMSIPILLESGNAFPQRSLIIFIASGVIVLTLIMATFIVPLLAPKKEDEETQRLTETEVVIEILRNVIEELNAQQTPENRSATQSVIRSYSKRIERIKENSDFDFETESYRELWLQALRWEQEYVLDLIDKQEVDPMIGYQYLNRIARIQTLLKHRKENKHVFQVATKHFKLFVRSLFHSLSSFLPGSIAATERAEKASDLHVRVNEYIIQRLQEEINNPETATEDASSMLLEYQQSLNTLRASQLSRGRRLSVTALSKRAQEKTKIERKGLEIEIEQVQAMCEEDRLSRATAKRMRENINLMQIDLEDHL